MDDAFWDCDAIITEQEQYYAEPDSATIQQLLLESIALLQVTSE